MRVTILLALLILTGPAAAHSFYDVECCHDQDCAPMPEADEPTALPGGDFRLRDGRVVSKAKVRWSPDNRFHLCQSATGHVFCLYVRVGGV